MTVHQIWEHALAGSRWLVEHQNPDGSCNGLGNPHVDAFYKVSWALMETGQPAAAHRALNYVQKQFFTAEGDFLPREHPSHINVHYLYPNAYIIIGSMIAGRYEIAVPAVRFLLTQQSITHGGFHSRLTSDSEKDMSDTMSSSMAGIACLTAGKTEAARKVADYLAHIIDLQPSPNHQFFTTIQADGSLYMETKDDIEAYLRIIDTRKAEQCWYAVGLPFAFLIRIADATNEKRYRNLAQWFFDFQSRCVDPWDGSSSGKSGWACAMLYRITSETFYRDIAIQIAENIASRQKADGSWSSLWENNKNGNQPALTNADIDITAEFTLWLSLIASNIISRDTCRISHFYANNKWCRFIQPGKLLHRLFKRLTG